MATNTKACSSSHAWRSGGSRSRDRASRLLETLEGEPDTGRRRTIPIRPQDVQGGAESIPLIPLATSLRVPGGSRLEVDIEDEDQGDSGSDISSFLDSDLDLDAGHSTTSYLLSRTARYPAASTPASTSDPQTYAEIRRHVRSFRSKADIARDLVIARGETRPGAGKMRLFDNLKGWDKEKRYRYLMLLGLSLAGDGWSYQATVIGSIIQLPAWLNHLGYGEGIPDSTNQWIGPVYSLGQAVGGLMAAFTLDVLGRKKCLWTGCVMMILSVILLVDSGSLAMVLAARVIEGVSIGFLLLGYQIYAVEIAAKEDRGFVSSFTLMTGNVFGLIASCIIYGISYVDGNSGWRAALGVTFIPAAALACLLPFVPESPRYLFEKGRVEESRNVLRRLHGGTLHADGSVALSESAQIEFDAMQAAITWDQEHGQDKWKAMWNTKAARYRSFVAITSQSWWAWNGGSIFTYYYTIVYYSAGITRTQDQFMIGAIQNATWCIGGVVGGYMLDYWGRRVNYLIGTGEACLLLIVQGAITIGIFDKGVENLSAGAAFVSIYLLQWFLWVTFFSPVVNMLPAEIYSAGLRARGYAVANVVSMGMGFATQYSALPMYRRMQGWVWIFFSGIMALAFLTIFFTYPETKGITLEEVETVFGTGAGQRVKEALRGRAGRADPSTPIHYRAQEDIEDVEEGKADKGPSVMRQLSA